MSDTASHFRTAFESLVLPHLDEHGDFRDIERAGRAVEAVRVEFNGTHDLRAAARKAIRAWDKETGKTRPAPLELTRRAHSKTEQFAILLAIRDYVYVIIDGKEWREQIGPQDTSYWMLRDVAGNLNSVEVHTLGVKDWLRGLIQHLLRKQKTASNQQGGEKRGDEQTTCQTKAKKRSWTQLELEGAIRKYKATRAPRYAELVEGVRRGQSGAKKAAQELFGRNVIVRELGVRSPVMVSNSRAWVAIAKDFGFELARDRTKGTRNTPKAGRIGHEMAVEQRSREVAGKADEIAPDIAAQQADQEKTLRAIARFAISGKTTKDKEINKEFARGLKEKYDYGEMTDEQVRQTIDELMTQL